MKTNTFSEKLEQVLDEQFKRLDGTEVLPIYNRPTAVGQAKQAIIDLVLNDVIGETVQLNDIYGNDWRNNYGYNETQVRDAANWLKRKQRAIIKGGNHESN